MSALIVILHIVICVILIVAILLQSGKAADLAGAFGGAGSQTAFGPRGTANLLSKITTVCAVLFMFTSLGLWILSARETKSVVRGAEAPKEVPAAAETKKETSEPKAQATEEKQPAEQKPAEQKSAEKEKKQ